MARKVSEWMRREAEADFFKLLGRTPHKPKPARDLLDELLSQGVSARAAARVSCAADAEDPFACAKPVPDKPRPSLPRSTAPVFSAPPVWTSDKRQPAAAVRTTKLPAAVVSFRFDPEHSWQSHEQINGFLLVTGGSGSGKSELLKSLAAQLVPQVPVLLFDVHGDLNVEGLRELKLGAGLGINPLHQPGKGDAQAREFVESLRLAVPSVGHVQGLLLSETVRALVQGGKADLHELRKALEGKRSQKIADRSAIVGLLASLDGLFGDPVFSAKPLDPAALLRASHRLKLAELGRSAQILVIDTLLRWQFARLKAAGPVSKPGELRLFGVIDEASLVKDSEILEAIFREGRKFGFGLALASQLAGDFGPAMRTNAGTLIALRAGSAREQATNARELGLPAADLAALVQPGAALLKDAAGVRRLQLARWPFPPPEPKPAKVAPPVEPKPAKAAPPSAPKPAKASRPAAVGASSPSNCEPLSPSAGDKYNFDPGAALADVPFVFSGEVSFHLEDIKALFKQLFWSISDDLTRTHLSAAVATYEYSLAATNGHTLCVVQSKIRFDRAYRFPHGLVKQVLKTASQPSAKLRLVYDFTTVAGFVGSDSMGQHAYSETFPPVDQVIPRRGIDSFPIELTKKELLSALDDLEGQVKSHGLPPSVIYGKTQHRGLMFTVHCEHRDSCVNRIEFFTKPDDYQDIAQTKRLTEISLRERNGKTVYDQDGKAWRVASADRNQKPLLTIADGSERSEPFKGQVLFDSPLPAQMSTTQTVGRKVDSEPVAMWSGYFRSAVKAAPGQCITLYLPPKMSDGKSANLALNPIRIDSGSYTAIVMPMRL